MILVFLFYMWNEVLYWIVSFVNETKSKLENDSKLRAEL